MPTTAHDVVIIGAGHNGLVAGAYLAKAGRSVLILERRERVGGILSDTELDGARIPAVVHTIGRLSPRVIGDLQLERHGLDMIRPEIRVFAPNLAGPPITLWSDPGRTAAGLRDRPTGDASAYPAFDARVRRIGAFLARLNEAAPPDIQRSSRADVLPLLRLGRSFRRLGPDGPQLLRALPMPVADFVGEVFEADALRAAIAARAVQFTSMGPWTAGTTAHLLADSAGNDGGAAGQTAFARGGPGALATALADAARSFGATIRTGADVVAVPVRGDRAVGVALATGEEIRARAIVSAADPKHALLRLVDPEVLGPTLRWRASNIRMEGCAAKVNMVLSGVPTFAGMEGPGQLLGRIVIAPAIEHLERAADAAKYGRVSEHPYLEATIPSLADPTLAPDGRHVMSVIVQWVPYRLREGTWEREREGLADRVVKTLESYAPGISNLVVSHRVLAPPDLEDEFGLTTGHVLHGEPGLDQIMAWRPLLGFARYRMPVDGLYLCGSGAHPGGGVTGLPGANAAREILKDLNRRRPRRAR